MKHVVEYISASGYIKIPSKNCHIFHQQFCLKIAGGVTSRSPLEIRLYGPLVSKEALIFIGFLQSFADVIIQ